MEKLTNREMLNLIKEELSANEKVVAWVDHQIELLDKKNAANSAKAKANQEKMVEVANTIVEALRESAKSLTITEILDLPQVKEIKVENDKNELVSLSNQRVSYILNHDNRVTREVNKKKAYFKVC
jgi:septum formation inhibitor-activating ATPase MinD